MRRQCTPALAHGNENFNRQGPACEMAACGGTPFQPCNHCSYVVTLIYVAGVFDGTWTRPTLIRASGWGPAVSCFRTVCSPKER